MAWTLFCADEKETLSAPTKEELALQVIQHLDEQHGISMTYEEALEKVTKDAKQTVA